MSETHLVANLRQKLPKLIYPIDKLAKKMTVQSTLHETVTCT